MGEGNQPGGQSAGLAVAIVGALAAVAVAVLTHWGDIFPKKPTSPTVAVLNPQGSQRPTPLPAAPTQVKVGPKDQRLKKPQPEVPPAPQPVAPTIPAKPNQPVAPAVEPVKPPSPTPVDTKLLLNKMVIKHNGANGSIYWRFDVFSGQELVAQIGLHRFDRTEKELVASPLGPIVWVPTKLRDAETYMIRVVGYRDGKSSSEGNGSAQLQMSPDLPTAHTIIQVTNRSHSLEPFDFYLYFDLVRGR